MANDTQRILDAIEKTGENLKFVLDNHEKRIKLNEEKIQALECAKVDHGLKIGFLIASVMGFGVFFLNLIKDALRELIK